MVPAAAERAADERDPQASKSAYARCAAPARAAAAQSRPRGKRVEHEVERGKEQQPRRNRVDPDWMMMEGCSPDSTKVACADSHIASGGARS
jgi:hypothetical protein